MKRLSGWTRLWIVFSLVWLLVGAWNGLTTYGLPPPGESASAHDLCLYQWSRTTYDVDSLWIPSRCEHDEEAVALARQLAPSTQSTYWNYVLGYALFLIAVPLLVWGVWSIGRWVQRGFTKPPTPQT